jgi:hypothetical protein
MTMDWQGAVHWKRLGAWALTWVLLYTLAHVFVPPVLRFRVVLPSVVYLGQPDIPVKLSMFKWRYCPAVEMRETWTSQKTDEKHSNFERFDFEVYPMGFTERKYFTSVPDTINEGGYYTVSRSIVYEGTFCNWTVPTNYEMIVIVATQDDLP